MSKFKTYRERIPLHKEAPEEKLTVPNLLDLQVQSFKRFLSDEGLRRRLAQEAPRRAATFTWERGAELCEESFLKCHLGG